LQDNVIDNITGQLRYLENDIYKSQRDVNRLSKVLDTLKQEYAKSMVYAYKSRDNYDFSDSVISKLNSNRPAATPTASVSQKPASSTNTPATTVRPAGDLGKKP